MASATSSISGLASGLDTASIIDQLMQLEAVPQGKLTTQQTAEKAVVTALRAVNTDTALFASKAAILAKPSTWQTLKGTVSGSGVGVTVGATASPTNFSVTIDKLATTHQVGFANAAALTDVVAGSTVKLTSNDGTEHDIAVGGGTLKEVVAALNAATSDTGVTATAVKVADGSYRLITESTKTGANSSFTLTNGDGNDLLGGTAVRAGGDAQISMGLGITATSSSNTFTDIVPGVTLTLASTATTGSTSTITVKQDSSSVAASVSGLVDQLNSLLTSIDAATAASTSTTAAGTLSGDPTSKSLRNALLETVFGSSTSTSMASVGIQTDRYGKIVFDADKFNAAYAADPAGVAAQFTTGATPETDGWAARLASVAKGASDSGTGTLTNAINGHNTTIDRLGKSIEDWDDRLELRRTSLERQYTALETALSTLNSQSSWLAGQIASLPSYDS